MPLNDGAMLLRGASEGTTRSAQQEHANFIQTAQNAVRIAVEQERLRIARDIHDHVGQHVIGILLRLAALEYRITEPTLRSSVCELRSIMAQFSEELKAVSAGERCGVPTGSELVPALERLIGEWKRATGIGTLFECNAMSGVEWSDAVAEVVYRIVQEALTNVAKHAHGATRAKIVLHSADWSLRLRVEDDGAGPAPEPRTHCPGPRGPKGIAGMRERVALLGGALEFRHTPHKGACLVVDIPLWRERNQAWGTS